MQKIFLLILSICFIITPVFATVKKTAEQVPDIKDELLEHPSFVYDKNTIKKEYIPIEDELLNYKPNSKSVFNLEVLKEEDFQDVVIKDELMSDDFIKQAINTKVEGIEIPDDNFIEKIVDVNRMRAIKPKTVYDFSKKAVSIGIKLPDDFQKKKIMLEGNEVPFIAMHDFIINGKTFAKGTEIIGRVETFSASDKMGTPESIKISNFYLNDEKKEINLHGSITKTGANRSYWVYPLYQAGNICFYVAGFIFVPIHGGHAKFSTKDTFTITYEE